MKIEAMTMNGRMPGMRTGKAFFGLRWRSEAATPLFSSHAYFRKRRGASLPAAVQIFASLRLVAFALILLPLCLRAAANDFSGALQKGLFEEEANRNLDAAIQAYQSVATQFDKDRQLAATAIFRLGECYRKLGKTNEAVLQYNRIVREFSDQPTLVTLSRQNLAGLGTTTPVNPARPEELQRQQLELQADVDELESLVAQVKKLDRHELRRVLPKVAPDPLLTGLLDEASLAMRNYGVLLQNPGESSPQTKAQATKLDQLDKLVEERVDTVVAGLERRLVNARKQLESLNAQAVPGRSVGAGAPLSQAARLEQRRLLEEEIKLAEQDLADVKKQVDVGKASQQDLRDKEREVLRLRRQLVGLDVGADSKPTGEAGAVTDDEEKEIRRIGEMIKNSPDLINAKGADGETPLASAAARGQLKVVQFLLENGADIKGQSRALNLAALNGHKAIVELLLNRGADVNAKDSDGLTPLHQAASRGFKSVVELLLAQKADVSARSNKENEGVTPLHLGATQGHAEMVAFLISKGAEVDAHDARGMTALSRAAMHGHTEVLNNLLSAGAKPDIQSEESMTAVSYAASRGHLDSVKALLAAKADPSGGKTNPSLFWAISNPECLRLLLEAGANPNGKDSSGQTPLLRAIERISFGREDFKNAELLIKYGADVNLANDKGVTPLQMAVWAQSVPIVSLLLTNRVDLSARDSAGRTVFDLARQAESGFMLGKLGGRDTGRTRPAGESFRPADKVVAREISALLRQHGAQDQVPDKQ